MPGRPSSPDALHTRTTPQDPCPRTSSPTSAGQVARNLYLFSGAQAIPDGQEGDGQRSPHTGRRGAQVGVSSRTPARDADRGAARDHTSGSKLYHHCDTRRKRSCSSSPNPGPWMLASLPTTPDCSLAGPTRLVVPCHGAAGVTFSWGPNRVRTPSAAHHMVTALEISARGATTRPEGARDALPGPRPFTRRFRTYRMHERAWVASLDRCMAFHVLTGDGSQGTDAPCDCCTAGHHGTEAVGGHPGWSGVRAGHDHGKERWSAAACGTRAPGLA
jgi:hypothetical protein